MSTSITNMSGLYNVPHYTMMGGHGDYCRKHLPSTGGTNHPIPLSDVEVTHHYERPFIVYCQSCDPDSIEGYSQIAMAHKIGREDIVEWFRQERFREREAEQEKAKAETLKTVKLLEDGFRRHSLPGPPLALSEEDQQRLIGLKIVGIRQLTSEEAGMAPGFNHPSQIQLIFSDGTTFSQGLKVLADGRRLDFYGMWHLAPSTQ